MAFSCDQSGNALTANTASGSIGTRNHATARHYREACRKSKTSTRRRGSGLQEVSDFGTNAKNKLSFCLPLVLCLIEGCFRPQGSGHPFLAGLGKMYRVRELCPVR